MTEKEQLVKDFISLIRTFCGEEMRRSARLPEKECSEKGNFITTFESDLVNQTKNLLK